MRGKLKVVVDSETLALMMVDYEGRILAEAGVEIKESRGGRANSNPVCSCGHKNPSGSKFCNMCGKSLKTEEEKIIDGLLDARATVLQFIPDGLKKDADAQIMRAVKLLKEKCGVQ